MKRKLPNINIATVGHVDHGKSTLIGRLLFDLGGIKPERKEEIEKLGGDFAFFMDHLEEERKEKRTIDVFYASLETSKYHFTFIDDPGHLEFIKNMLTGISQADGVVLVVSAKKDEGIQEQTKRHIRLVKLLGISQILVAVNKMDAVGYDQRVYEKMKVRVENLLKKLGYKSKIINFLPVSARQGDNVYKKSSKMNWYKGKTFYQLLDKSFEPALPPIEKPLRLSVQDIYQDNGGKLIIGKVETGIISIGDLVFFSLAHTQGKVVEIKALDRNKNQACSGESIGFKIDGDALRIQRGEVVCHKENLARVRERVIGEIFLLSNKEVKIEERLSFRCGTAERECQIKAILQRASSESGKVLAKDSKSLGKQELGRVKLAFSKPLVVERFSDFPHLGRFILLRDRQVVAPGICLD